MANTLSIEDEATLQNILDRAYEQAARRQLEEQLHDLDGRYMCLNRQHTQLVQVSQSQAGLLKRIEELAREASQATTVTGKQLLLLDIIGLAANGAAVLNKALEAPIVIRKE